jgi:hypothetical protein
MTKRASVANTRAPHTDAQLRTATDYLEFDLKSLIASLRLYGQHKGTPVGNAAVDSLLIRSRVLIDFLFPASPKPDDMIASDFFHDFPQQPVMPRLTKTLSRERQKINKRLMHLTTEPMPRLRSNQKYAVGKIVPPIVRAFKKWLSQVPDKRIQKPAKRSRAQLESHLAELEKLVPKSSSR